MLQPYVLISGMVTLVLGVFIMKAKLIWTTQGSFKMVYVQMSGWEQLLIQVHAFAMTTVSFLLIAKLIIHIRYAKMHTLYLYIKNTYINNI